MPLFDITRLAQPVAAALLGIAPRKLRDLPAPRNPDGTYSGPSLLAWRCRRATAAEIVASIEHLDGDGVITASDALCPRLKSLIDAMEAEGEP